MKQHVTGWLLRNIGNKDIGKKMEQCTEKWMPYMYWLDKIPGIGRQMNYRLLQTYNSPIKIYNIEETELRNLLNREQFHTFREEQKKTPEQIIYEYEKLKEKRIRFIPHNHADFPHKLQKISDMPFAIYVHGELPREDVPSIAMIGARKCSEYGKQVATKFAAEFTKYGCQIISGMASGIDGISQRVAIEQGGKTYAVLGSGVDVCYPKSNIDIFEKIPKQGGIISEYCPGTGPLAWQFPPRNRIISALADVVLVVEAQEKSGTLITVDMALEQGKEVYAVPGRCTDLLSKGCNRLIAQGAGVALDPIVILKDVFGEEVSINNEVQEKSALHNAKEDRSEDTIRNIKVSLIGEHIYEIMDVEPATIDEIYYRFKAKNPQTLCGITDFMCEIMDLQMKGYVGGNGGKYYRIYQ